MSAPATSTAVTSKALAVVVARNGGTARVPGQPRNKR